MRSRVNDNLAQVALSDATFASPSLPTLSPTLISSSGPVLIGLLESERPTDCIRRAFALARMLDADVHVLIVASPGTSGPRTQVELLEARGQLLQNGETIRDWIEGIIGRTVPQDNLRVRTGGLVAQVACRANELGSRLIVVAPGTGARSIEVTELVRDTGRPVLVPRGEMTNQSIVAATDLRDEALPVLQKAGEWASQLGARIVAVHNISSEGSDDDQNQRWAPTLPGGAVTAERRALLSRAVGRLELAADLVVANERNAADAILCEARLCSAGLVVVGTRRHAWFDGLVSENVAAEVLERAQIAVLVMPIASVEPSLTRPLAQA